MHRTRLVVGAAGVIALLLALLAAPAGASHSWSDYHWARQSNPFTLQVIDSVTADWQSDYDTALGDWSRATELSLTTTSAKDDSKTRKRCPAATGMIRVCNASYGQNGWLGLASISIDSNHHITSGVAKMNDSYGWYFASNAGETLHVMCQEIGHLFGLGHTSEDGSSQSTCMDYSNSPTSLRPNDHDYDQIALIYGHEDSYTTLAGGDGGGSGGPCRGPSWKCNGSGGPDEFGQLVSSSEHHQLWMKRGPGGEMTLTHLTLAPRR